MVFLFLAVSLGDLTTSPTRMKTSTPPSHQPPAPHPPLAALTTGQPEKSVVYLKGGFKKKKNYVLH